MTFEELKEGVGQDYTVSTWTGSDKAKTKYQNYECTRCQFSSLYQQKLVEHYEYQDKHNHHWAFPVGSDEESKVPKVDSSSAQPVPLKY